MLNKGDTLLLERFFDFAILMRPNAWLVTVFSLSLGAVIALQNITITNEMWLGFIMVCFVFACFIASGLYVLNDVNDRDLDRKNPEKMNRPIASGRITVVEGIAFSFILLSVGCFLALQISFIHFILALALIFLQLIYSMHPIRLKETAVDFLFSGPLNHLIRFGAAWILFRPVLEIPFVFLLGLFVLYCVAYIHYKLFDKKFVPKDSFARKKQVQSMLHLGIVSGIFLLFLSIILFKEINLIFVLIPGFLTLCGLAQLLFPVVGKIELIKKLFVNYGEFALFIVIVNMWLLLVL